MPSLWRVWRVDRPRLNINARAFTAKRNHLTFSRVTQDETLFTCFTFDDSFTQQTENLSYFFFRTCRSTIVFVETSFTRSTFHFGWCIRNDSFKAEKSLEFLYLFSYWTWSNHFCRTYCLRRTILLFWTIHDYSKQHSKAFLYNN